MVVSAAPRGILDTRRDAAGDIGGGAVWRGKQIPRHLSFTQRGMR